MCKDSNFTGQPVYSQDSDMGGAHRKPAHHCHLTEHKTQLRLLSGGDNGAADAHVLH